MFAYCQRAHPEVEHDLDQRLSHARGRRDRRAGDRLHARRRDRLRRRRRSTPGSRSTTSRRGCRSSSPATRTSSRRSRSSARRGGMWARIMRERFGAEDPRALMLRFHTQTGGATLDRAAAARTTSCARRWRRWRRCSAARSRCTRTRSTRRSRCRPSRRRSSRCARSRSSATRRGVAETVDPLGGSYFVEALTDELERLAAALHREDRRDGRRRRGDRGGLLPGRDPRGGVPDPAGDRARRPGRGRRQPVRRCRTRRAARAADGSPRRRSRGRSSGCGELRAVAGPGGRGRGARRRAGRRGGHRATCCRR